MVDTLPVVEIMPVADTFCSGVSKIEHIGHGLVRYYLYTQQGNSCGEGPMERVLVAKIVLPIEAMRENTFRRMTVLHPQHRSDLTASAAKLAS